MYVYFVQAGGVTGPVKIGIAVDPVTRVTVMQVGNHEAIVLLAAVLGSVSRERVAAIACYTARKRAITTAWKATRKW